MKWRRLLKQYDFFCVPGHGEDSLYESSLAPWVVCRECGNITFFPEYRYDEKRYYEEIRKLEHALAENELDYLECGSCSHQFSGKSLLFIYPWWKLCGRPVFQRESCQILDKEKCYAVFQRSRLTLCLSGEKDSPVHNELHFFWTPSHTRISAFMEKEIITLKGDRLIRDSRRRVVYIDNFQSTFCSQIIHDPFNKRDLEDDGWYYPAIFHFLTGKTGGTFQLVFQELLARHFPVMKFWKIPYPRFEVSCGKLLTALRRKALRSPLAFARFITGSDNETVLQTFYQSSPEKLDLYGLFILSRFTTEARILARIISVLIPDDFPDESQTFAPNLKRLYSFGKWLLETEPLVRVLFHVFGEEKTVHFLVLCCRNFKREFYRLNLLTRAFSLMHIFQADYLVQISPRTPISIPRLIQMVVLPVADYYVLPEKHYYLNTVCGLFRVKAAGTIGEFQRWAETLNLEYQDLIVLSSVPFDEIAVFGVFYRGSLNYLGLAEECGERMYFLDQLLGMDGKPLDKGTAVYGFLREWAGNMRNLESCGVFEEG